MLKKSFKIDLSIYEEKKILECIKKFEENGFELDFRDSEISLIGETDEEINEIFNEFMNYVIYLQV